MSEVGAGLFGYAFATSRVAAVMLVLRYTAAYVHSVFTGGLIDATHVRYFRRIVRSDERQIDSCIVVTAPRAARAALAAERSCARIGACGL